MGIRGKTIVFTGKISKPRHEFEKLVTDNGGKLGASVTKNTDYLVLGEKPGSKLAVATQLGTKVVNEEEFWNLLKEETLAEEPLTEEELAELESHMTTRTCRWCGVIHKQFDTVPDYQTCPVCEILSKVKCPKCGSQQERLVFQTDTLFYYCRTCNYQFEAPHTQVTYYTTHVHIPINGQCYLCKKRSPSPNKIRPSQGLVNLREYVQEQSREQARKNQEWFDSLSEEQINELRKRINENKQ